MDPIAVMTMENGAEIVIELLPAHAPNTVASFIHLAKLGVFDVHAIERIVPGNGWTPATGRFIGRRRSTSFPENPSSIRRSSLSIRIPDVYAWADTRQALREESSSFH